MSEVPLYTPHPNLEAHAVPNMRADSVMFLDWFQRDHGSVNSLAPPPPLSLSLSLVLSLSRGASQRPVWKPTLPAMFSSFDQDLERGHVHHRGTSLIRNRTPLGPYNRPMRRALWCSWGGGVFS